MRGQQNINGNHAKSSRAIPLAAPYRACASHIYVGYIQPLGKVRKALGLPWRSTGMAMLDSLHYNSLVGTVLNGCVASVSGVRDK